MMTQSAHHIMVEWGDCDPAGIVFFPNYLRWMDESALHLFESIGLGWKTLQYKYNTPGLPVVRIQTDFLWPATFGEKLEIMSDICQVNSRSISINHLISNGDKTIVTGLEKRVWSTGGPVVKGKIRLSRIPADITLLLKKACQ